MLDRPKARRGSWGCSVSGNRLPADAAALVTEYQSAVLSCEYCGTTDGPIVVDHIVPKSRGGALTRDNLASACEPCNQKKAARLGWVTLERHPIRLNQ
ncbi:HNH endonuclease [Methylobacterium sp. WL12]|nr:HNH endonuclease [Methylobacterium sp. WL12]